MPGPASPLRSLLAAVGADRPGVPWRSLSQPCRSVAGGADQRFRLDWFQSRVVPLGERQPAFADYFEDARRRAEAALAAIGWRHTGRCLRNCPRSTNCSAVCLAFSRRSRRVPLQRIADGLLATAAGPALLLVEAPMGEGKTELALLAHLRLQAANQHRGLYLALPTRATGNALFRRVRTFLEAFAGGDGADVQLVHGGGPGRTRRSLHFARDRRRRRCKRGVLGLVRPSSAGAALLYGVGTVDQALFAALNVKHHFVLLWGWRTRLW